MQGSHERPAVAVVSAHLSRDLDLCTSAYFTDRQLPLGGHLDIKGITDVLQRMIDLNVHVVITNLKNK